MRTKENHDRPPCYVAADQPTRCWYARDFVYNRLAAGQRLRCFTMTDLYSKELLAIEEDISIGGGCGGPDQFFAGRSWPETMILGNWSKFSHTSLDVWAGHDGALLRFVQLEKPGQSAYIERINGTFRDACLNEHGFLALPERRS